ncbi:MAG: hypothetical protein LC751_08210 [Actinobacteria bacterium]|nr:hypothetical protein [Actinomycetota bacterium]
MLEGYLMLFAARAKVRFRVEILAAAYLAKVSLLEMALSSLPVSSLLPGLLGLRTRVLPARAKTPARVAVPPVSKMAGASLEGLSRPRALRQEAVRASVWGIPYRVLPWTAALPKAVL